MSNHAAGVSRRKAVYGGAVAAGGALVGGGALAASGAFGRDTTEAQTVAAQAPSVLTRADWKARPPKKPIEVLDNGPTYIVVHHTAGPNSDDFSKEHALQVSRDIQNLHMDDNGWDDTGQQLTISRGGHIMEGREQSLPSIGDGKLVLGAHVGGHNDHALGIENEGTYMDQGPPDELYGSLVDTCAWLCDSYGLDPHEAIVGHRDFNETQCPGDELYAMLPKLRDDVAAKLKAAGAAPPTTTKSDVPPSQRPTNTKVPEGRPERNDHGPALGKGDPNYAEEG